MRHPLVICIGNRARGDDGAGRRVADLLDGDSFTDVTIVSTPQLDVVMAEEVAEASIVVFVDADRRDAPPVRTEPLIPDTAHTNAHAIDPAGLLALADTLYGARPDAMLVSISGPDMGHSEGLSDTAEAASREAVSVVRSMLCEES